MLKVKKFTFNPFSENTYIVYDDSNECVIIDPGCFTSDEENILDNYITENQLKPVMLWHTHSHLDHVFGSSFVSKKYGIDLWIHKEDLQTLSSFETVCNMYGLPVNNIPPAANHFFDLEKGISFGNSKLEIRFVPGHAPGHVVFISNDSNFIINGDCLFDGSIGRTDLPGGNHQLLLDSIKKELFTLNDGLIVYCGHGPETTIGKEKSSNPFLK
jgi:hydroxyacylglutathione hydrolase